MHRFIGLLLAGAALCAGSHPAPAQKFVPRSIQFRGDPEYTDQELMTAAGLKKGMALTHPAMNQHSQQLLATGMFATVAFKFDGRTLVFTLTPSADLADARFEGFPAPPGADLNAALHAQFPLFHGKVPTEGGMMEAVRAQLEKLLAEQGVTARVTATATDDAATHRVQAVVYAVAPPAVVMGDVKLDGVSAPFEAAVQEAAGAVSKLPYAYAATASNLQQAVEQIYADQGYAAAQVQVTPGTAVITPAHRIEVPIDLLVQEGRVYKLGVLHLPMGALILQDDVNKMLADRRGAPPQGVRVRQVWEAIAQRYQAKGFFECKVTPHAEVDEAAGTVSYTADVNPGPVYHLGSVTFDKVSDPMRALLMRDWQMKPGDVYDATYVAQFLAKAKQDGALKRSLAGMKETFDTTPNPQTHEVNVVIHLSR